ncbi:hypothetical protein IF2G_03618 [Cordyceps javanica]|nr:hypothetical protein IF2G_03618 [Cordyceps javanica]
MRQRNGVELVARSMRPSSPAIMLWLVYGVHYNVIIQSILLEVELLKAIQSFDRRIANETQEESYLYGATGCLANVPFSSAHPCKPLGATLRHGQGTIRRAEAASPEPD